MPDSRWKLISICTLCEEGDPRRKSRSNLWSIFLSTPSARRATERPIRQALELSISIHALREEGDPRRKSRSNLWSIFLSTPSVRRATPSRHFLLRADAYFYPRPPRGGRQPGLAGRKDISYFYPRPPRGGRRLGQTGRATQFPISIYALREEGDRTLTGKWPKARAFLSTPSARRATLQCLVTWSSHRYFYPRPPRGGRPSAAGQHAEPDRFLSTPSARRATPRPQKWPWYKKFLSTPSARRATPNLQHLSIGFFEFLSTPSARRATRCCHPSGLLLRHFYPRPPRGGRPALGTLRKPDGTISIHALREEGDHGSLQHDHDEPISIHALREEGDAPLCSGLECLYQFLSTPSARRATGCPRLPFRGPRISIHALREEGDEVCLLGVAVGRDFYPRPPRGGRREDVRVSRQSRGISIHALREEGDYTESRGRSGAAYFYPRPPRGGRPLCASALA